MKHYVVDTLKKQVVGNAEPHNGSADYIDVDSGATIIKFKDGKPVQYGWDSHKLYNWLKSLHVTLWNEATKPAPDRQVHATTSLGSASLLITHPNRYTVDIWDNSGDFPTILLTIEDGHVISVASNIPFTLLDAAVTLYKKEYR